MSTRQNYPLIEIREVAKYFVAERSFVKRIFSLSGAGRKIRAVEGISVNIHAGEILGLIGPNGAGKTTLMRILADLLIPDKGKVIIKGKETGRQDESVRKVIGYVSSDERSFFWRLTGRQNLQFFGQLYGLSRREAIRRTVEIIEEFDFAKKADQLFKGYSAGMRKKCAVMRALMHRPQIVLLDEVTNSLDQKSTRMVKAVIRKYVSMRDDRAAVWSTHRLEEISEVCDKVLEIDEGHPELYCSAKEFMKGNSFAGNYVLKLKNLNGSHQAFHERYRNLIVGESHKKGEVSEFVLNGISDDDFGRIVSLAVKDYGAFIVFAGCLNKEQNCAEDK